MTKDELYEVLKIILEKIGDERLNWRLEGSVNLLVQGMELSPKDLDIAVDEPAKNVFQEKLAEYFVDEKMDNIKGADVLKTGYEINGMEVETLLQRNDTGLDMLDKVEVITWRGLQLPIILLQQAKVFYERTGRREKVDLIDKFLKK